MVYVNYHLGFIYQVMGNRSVYKRKLLDKHFLGFNQQKVR